MTGIIHDLRYAVRQLRKNPGFTVVAAITLALGIGATTTMFSVVNSVLLRPLPFRQPDRLMELGEYDTRNGDPGNLIGSLSYPDVADLRARNHSFEDIAAYDFNQGTLTGLREPLHVNVSHVNAGMFRLLGVQPFLGRDFRPEEEQPGHYVATISNKLWRTYLNSDRNVIGRSLTLNGRSFTIVGVMPPGFQFPITSDARDVWLTFSREAEKDAPEDTPVITQRGNHFCLAIARLKNDIALPAAASDVTSIARALAHEYPGSNAYSGIAVLPELQFLVGETRTPLLILLAAVGLVLLIACGNVANLVLVRSSGRSREIGVRASLGARRSRIIQQLITESTLLSVTGSVLGLVLANGMLQALLRFYPENLPRAEQINIDLRVLSFSAGLAIVTGVLFGLAPALKASSPNLAETMRESSRTATAGTGTHRVRSALVIAQIALGVMLLVGAGLLLRSLNRLSHVDLGFDPNHLLTASFDLSETRYNPDQQDRFVLDLLSRLKNLPGVTAASGAIPLPLSNNAWTISFNWPDHPVPEENEPSANVYLASTGLFEAMKIPLLRGRTFEDRDQRNSAPVMIVTDSFARKFFHDQDPIGRKITIGAGEGPSRDRYKTREIIGVVGDIRTNKLDNTPDAAYYIPISQLMWGTPTLVIRTAADPATVAGNVRKILNAMDPDVPLYEIRTMGEYLAVDLGRARFQATLLGLFATMALILTAVGLYGVMSQAVAQRTHEIGVRMAMGATRESVLAMVLSHGTTLTVIGTVIGIGGALALARLIESLLYQIPPRDPATYLGVSVILGLVAIAASYVPAHRAAKVDPMVALRYE
jgi:putative ABC transport system permease protein